jgi:hypothetical protein
MPKVVWAHRFGQNLRNAASDEFGHSNFSQFRFSVTPKRIPKYMFLMIQRWYSDAKFEVNSDFAINHTLK